MENNKRPSNRRNSSSFLHSAIASVTLLKCALVIMITAVVAVSILFFIPSSESENFQEIWRDDFNGNKLDESKWYFGEIGCSGNGNDEQQCYTDHNARVEGGNLIIQAKVEPGGGGKQFSSSRIHGKQGFVFGRFEARAKLPKGRHLWPAIWMMPLKSEFGEWPRSGEIDIMEYRGERPSMDEGTLHYGDKGHIYEGSKPHDFAPIDFSKDFHEFRLDRTPTKITWYVDGKEFYSYNTNKRFGTTIYKKNGEPFDKEFYWIFNVAVGGGFFPPNPYGPPVTPEEGKKWEKATMEVDWVKVSKLV